MMRETLIMTKACGMSAVIISLVATLGAAAVAGDVSYIPEYTDDGQLIQPSNFAWREWPFVGTPLTPDALNDGAAPFPEFHIVYIDPDSWEHWKKTGEFRDGTVLAKELTLVGGKDEANEDGSTNQVSGTGYFMGEYSGFEITIKSKEHYPDEPGNWAYYTFGHHAPPYAATSPLAPTESCNTCHEVSAAQDFVFTQFYPVLLASKPK
jgi:hypothetical protein